MKKIEEELAALPRFEHVHEALLRTLAAAGHVSKYASGSVVFRAGEAADELHVILSGEAKVLGKPRVRTLEPGDVFGEMALLDQGLRSATIAAASELRTLVLPRQVVLEWLEQDPRFAQAIAAELSRRVRRLEGATGPEPTFDESTGWPLPGLS
jgi:CRP/FNR family cyclic AMP-dependent transcriptional regulator